MKQHYDMDQHRHLFYAWGAATAARQSPKCRFSVREGIALLETSFPDGSSLVEFAKSVENLPEASEFDEHHRRWRGYLVERAPAIISNANSRFTHGVAAKLINCYFKGVFTCGGYGKSDKIDAIHPPIDRLLLNNLVKPENKVSDVERIQKLRAKKIIWRKYRDLGWSNFTSSQYEDVIGHVRDVYGKELWRIEECWPGAQ